MLYADIASPLQVIDLLGVSSSLQPVRLTIPQLSDPDHLQNLRHVQYHDTRSNAARPRFSAEVQHRRPLGVNTANLAAMRRLQSIRQSYVLYFGQSKTPDRWGQDETGIIIKTYEPPSSARLGQLSPLTLFLIIRDGHRPMAIPDHDEHNYQAFTGMEDEIYLDPIQVPLHAIQPAHLVASLTGEKDELNSRVWECVGNWLAEEARTEARHND